MFNNLYYPLIKVQLKKVFTAGAAWIIVKFSGPTTHTRKPLASLQAKTKSWIIQHNILIISKQLLQKFTIMLELVYIFTEQTSSLIVDTDI